MIAFKVIEIILSNTWALRSKILDLMKIVFSIFWRVSVDNSSCCLRSSEVSGWSWFFLSFGLANYCLGNHFSWVFSNFSWDRPWLYSDVISIGSWDKFFVDNSLIHIVFLVTKFMLRRLFDEIVLMIWPWDLVFEGLPLIITISEIVNILDWQGLRIQVFHRCFSINISKYKMEKLYKFIKFEFSYSHVKFSHLGWIWTKSTYLTIKCNVLLIYMKDKYHHLTDKLP